MKAGEQAWAKLMKPAVQEGVLSHTFPDNKTTRNKIAELLA